MLHIAACDLAFSLQITIAGLASCISSAGTSKLAIHHHHSPSLLILSFPLASRGCGLCTPSCLSSFLLPLSRPPVPTLSDPILPTHPPQHRLSCEDCAQIRDSVHTGQGPFCKTCGAMRCAALPSMEPSTRKDRRGLCCRCCCVYMAPTNHHLFNPHLSCHHFN